MYPFTLLFIFLVRARRLLLSVRNDANPGTFRAVEDSPAAQTLPPLSKGGAATRRRDSALVNLCFLWLFWLLWWRPDAMPSMAHPALGTSRAVAVCRSYVFCSLRPARQDGRKIRCSNALYFFPFADFLIRQTVVAHQDAAKACGTKLAD